MAEEYNEEPIEEPIDPFYPEPIIVDPWDQPIIDDPDLTPGDWEIIDVAFDC